MGPEFGLALGLVQASHLWLLIKSSLQMTWLHTLPYVHWFKGACCPALTFQGLPPKETGRADETYTLKTLNNTGHSWA